MTELSTKLNDGFATFSVTNAGFYAFIEKGSENKDSKKYILLVTAAVVILIIVLTVIRIPGKKKSIEPVVNVLENMDDHEYDILK